MTHDPYDVAIEQLGLDAGTLTELHSMGISTVGQAIELVQRDRTILDGIPDFQMGDWQELEDRLDAYGYLNDYIDKIVVPGDQELDDEDILDDYNLDQDDDL